MVHNESEWRLPGRHTLAEGDCNREIDRFNRLEQHAQAMCPGMPRQSTPVDDMSCKETPLESSDNVLMLVRNVIRRSQTKTATYTDQVLRNMPCYKQEKFLNSLDDEDVQKQLQLLSSKADVNEILTTRSLERAGRESVDVDILQWVSSKLKAAQDDDGYAVERRMNEVVCEESEARAGSAMMDIYKDDLVANAKRATDAAGKLLTSQTVSRQEQRRPSRAVVLQQRAKCQTTVTFSNSKTPTGAKSDDGFEGSGNVDMTLQLCQQQEALERTIEQKNTHIVDLMKKLDAIRAHYKKTEAFLVSEICLRTALVESAQQEIRAESTGLGFTSSWGDDNAEPFEKMDVMKMMQTLKNDVATIDTGEREKLETLRTEHLQLQSNYQSLKIDSEAEIASLKQMVSSLTYQNTELEREVADGNEVNLHMRTRNSQLADELAELEGESKQRVVTLMAKNEALVGEIERLEESRGLYISPEDLDLKLQVENEKRLMIEMEKNDEAHEKDATIRQLQLSMERGTLQIRNLNDDVQTAAATEMSMREGFHSFFNEAASFVTVVTAIANGTDTGSETSWREKLWVNATKFLQNTADNSDICTPQQVGMIATLRELEFNPPEADTQTPDKDQLKVASPSMVRRKSSARPKKPPPSAPPEAPPTPVIEEPRTPAFVTAPYEDGEMACILATLSSFMRDVTAAFCPVSRHMKEAVKFSFSEKGLDTLSEPARVRLLEKVGTDMNRITSCMEQMSAKIWSQQTKIQSADQQNSFAPAKSDGADKLGTESLLQLKKATAVIKEISESTQSSLLEKHATGEERDTLKRHDIIEQEHRRAMLGMVVSRVRRRVVKHAAMKKIEKKIGALYARLGEERTLGSETKVKAVEEELEQLLTSARLESFVSDIVCTAMCNREVETAGARLLNNIAALDTLHTVAARQHAQGQMQAQIQRQRQQAALPCPPPPVAVSTSQHSLVPESPRVHLPSPAGRVGNTIVYDATGNNRGIVKESRDAAVQVVLRGLHKAVQTSALIDSEAFQDFSPEGVVQAEQLCIKDKVEPEKAPPARKQSRKASPLSRMARASRRVLAMDSLKKTRRSVVPEPHTLSPTAELPIPVETSTSGTQTETEVRRTRMIGSFAVDPADVEVQKSRPCRVTRSRPSSGSSVRAGSRQHAVIRESLASLNISLDSPGGEGVYPGVRPHSSASRGSNGSIHVPHAQDAQGQGAATPQQSAEDHDVEDLASVGLPPSVRLNPMWQIEETTSQVHHVAHFAPGVNVRLLMESPAVMVHATVFEQNIVDGIVCIKLPTLDVPPPMLLNSTPSKTVVPYSEERVTVKQSVVEKDLDRYKQDVSAYLAADHGMPQARPGSAPFAVLGGDKRAAKLPKITFPPVLTAPVHEGEVVGDLAEIILQNKRTERATPTLSDVFHGPLRRASMDIVSQALAMGSLRTQQVITLKASFDPASPLGHALRAVYGAVLVVLHGASMGVVPSYAVLIKMR